jgi:hypothetical protein
MELILDLVLLYWKQIIVIYLSVVLLILIVHFLLNIISMVHSLKRIEENTTTIAGRLHELNATYDTLHKVVCTENSLHSKGMPP